MKLFLSFVAFFIVKADDLYWVDYETGFEYDWSILAQQEDYILQTDSDYVHFNFGKNVVKTCHGHPASAIKFSKVDDSCEILGRHELMFFTPFESPTSSGLIFFYEGGDVCRNRYFTGFKRRIEFRLTCSSYETSFNLANPLDECTSIVERASLAGCYASYEYTIWTKLLFVM